MTTTPSGNLPPMPSDSTSIEYNNQCVKHFNDGCKPGKNVGDFKKCVQCFADNAGIDPNNPQGSDMSKWDAQTLADCMGDNGNKAMMSAANVARYCADDTDASKSNLITIILIVVIVFLVLILFSMMWSRKGKVSGGYRTYDAGLTGDGMGNAFGGYRTYDAGLTGDGMESAFGGYRRYDAGLTEGNLGYE